MPDYDGEAIVMRHCELVAGRTRFDADLSSTNLRALTCAIVFVNAFWSCPSLAALESLAETIYELDPTGAITLVVCDADCLPAGFDRLLGIDSTAGIGEMAWICNGKLISRHHARARCDTYATTRGLLSRFGAEEGTR